MGEDNANHGRRLDRAKAPEMTAAQLVSALTDYSKAAPIPEHRAAFALAAATIKKLARRGVNPELEASHYTCQTDDEAHEAKIAFFRGNQTLSFMILDSPGLYTVANNLLRCYDRLEGIGPKEDE